MEKLVGCAHLFSKSLLYTYYMLNTALNTVNINENLLEPHNR